MDVSLWVWVLVGVSLLSGLCTYVHVCPCVALLHHVSTSPTVASMCLFSVCHAHVTPPSSVAHTETPCQRLPGVGQQCQLAEGPQCSG